MSKTKNKIIITTLVVFLCGILAVTIPKKASAATQTIDIDVPNGDGTPMTTFLRSNINDNWMEYVYLDNPIVIRGEHISYSLTRIDYQYYRNGDGWLIRNPKLYVDFWQNNYPDNIYTQYAELDYVYNTKLTDLESFKTTAVWFETLEFDVTLTGAWNQDSNWEIEMEVSTKKTDSLYVYGYSYSDIDWLGTQPHDQFTQTTAMHTFTPTLLLYYQLYHNHMIAYNFPTYIDSDTNFLEFLKTSTTGFLETNVIGDLSFGDILLFVVSIGLLVFILRFFAGG